MSLVELLVTMVLLAVLGALVAAAVLISQKQVRISTDESIGLSDTRVVVERLGRDIRGSRGVDAGATGSNLSLWIDYNSDYIRSAAQANELITWTVVDNGTGTQFNTLRSTAGGAVQTQARTLVNNLAFCYLTAPSTSNLDCLPTPLSAANAANTRIVKVTLSYDSALNFGSQARTNTFYERIRNVS